MYWIYAYRQKKYHDMVTEIEAIQRAPPKVIGVFNFGPEKRRVEMPIISWVDKSPPVSALQCLGDLSRFRCKTNIELSPRARANVSRF